MIRGELLVRKATLAEILELRQAVLIAGTARADAVFEGDGSFDTSHFAAFERSNTARCVACVSYMRADFDGEPAYQLRGMAVTPELQGRGVGSALLLFAETRMCTEQSIGTFWCNARTRAIRFYERHGWRAVGDVFDIAGVGPHRRMTKRVS